MKRFSTLEHSGPPTIPRIAPCLSPSRPVQPPAVGPATPAVDPAPVLAVTQPSPSRQAPFREDGAWHRLGYFEERQAKVPAPLKEASGAVRRQQKKLCSAMRRGVIIMEELPRTGFPPSGDRLSPSLRRRPAACFSRGASVARLADGARSPAPYFKGGVAVDRPKWGRSRAA